MWARSYAIGCGAVRCEELRGAEEANENALFLVCDYGPGYVDLYIVNAEQMLSNNSMRCCIYTCTDCRGNFYGEPPYQTGNEVCSACPADKKYCVNNLCGQFKVIIIIANYQFAHGYWSSRYLSC